MRFRGKLMAAFGGVAVITLGVSLLGVWQANRLGSALYEVGVVRLPSIAALSELRDAKADLDASASTLAMSAIADSTITAERARQSRAWAQADRAWAAYEPLPQTAEESAVWKAFVPVWQSWKAAYDTAVSAGQEARIARLAAPSAEVDALLAQLNVVNVKIATSASKNSVDEYQDLEVVRSVMLLAALLSVVGAIATGFLLGGRVSRPLTQVSDRLARIERGDLTTPLPFHSDDEIGEIASAVNSLVARLRATEAERAQASEAHRTSEEKFSKVFMSAPVGIALTGLSDARILETNDQFLSLLGYRREEVIGRTSLELAIWPDAATRERLMLSMRQDGRSMSEERLRAKDGDVRIVRAAAHVLEIDGESVIVSAVVDVTDQRRAETELRRSEQLYRTLVEGVRDVIVAMTPDGVLTALNSAFEQVTGMPRTQWIGQSFMGLLVPDDVPLATSLFQAVLRGDARPITTLRIRTADGRIRIGEIFLTAHREHGDVVAVLGIARDVTDRVHLEEEFRQAQKMEAVGRLAGGIAHDFNNLLTVIGGHCTFLLEDLEQGDPRREDVDEILNASTVASTLTRQLLAFSRREVMQPKVLNLNEVVTASEKLLRRLIRADVRLVTTLASNVGSVRADAGQLEQTIMNLAVNGRDAMPHGGTVTITTDSVELSEARVRGHPDAIPGRYVKLTVSDTGMGMDDETKARIFEPFFTTKDVGKGTGLGLATVFGIVKQSKGIIRVDSEVGHGTTFELFFPEVVDSS